MEKIAQRPVGRPREFDENRVLEAAMNAFWNKGYEATSLAELCRVTGLNKGSLYQAFGDKHSLFMRALTHYSEMEYREVMAVAVQHESPLARIRAIVRKICDDACGGRGCMINNSMVELAPHDPEVKAALQTFGEQRMQGLTGVIGAAQLVGEIRAELEPRKLARQLMMTLAGAAAMSKGFLSNDETNETLAALIDSWT
ncbi:MAG TPA: TetR/AcrR family transcriptional regulator [Gammaproteobacteria bacterium]|jgi:TetR/AcrR family transcriptional repressor of nem operon